ncbi:efflux RND transporter periplasmic adaptor subunit [Niveibacterium terrae]|uniref:efflux RND transporter periplasmic adaptor subunit n=1 Tax=Niveibacterium terrae TaxID=3373598 RepID=UPI003A94D223
MPPRTPDIEKLRLALLAAAALVLFGCGDSTSRPAKEILRPAYVTEARPANPDGLSFTGEVRARQRAELAFATSGRVARVMVEPGDVVRRGQVLAELDVQPIRAQLDAAEAGLRRAEAQLYEVRQRMDRLRIARKSDAVSAAELSSTQAELESAESAVRGARAQREAADWSMKQATLRAPFDGVLAARSIEPGQTGGLGLAAVSIDGAGRELSLLVPGNLSLKPGQIVSLQCGQTRLQSKVLRTGGRLEAGGVRKVFVALPDDAVVGATWSAVLGTSTLQKVWVPLRAVLLGRVAGEGSVLRLGKDGRTTEQVALKLGAFRGDWIEVSEGLAAGDRIVVAGATAIRPGTAIKPVAMARLETLR